LAYYRSLFNVLRRPDIRPVQENELSSLFDACEFLATGDLALFGSELADGGAPLKGHDGA
jgi:hypothetical protein